VREVEVSKTIKTKDGFKTITKKGLFSDNSVYFSICKDIQEIESSESKSHNQSSRKSSRRKYKA